MNTSRYLSKESSRLSRAKLWVSGAFQMLVSRGQRYGVEFVDLAGCTLMLVRHGNKALEQGFHVNRRIDLGNVR